MFKTGVEKFIWEGNKNKGLFEIQLSPGLTLLGPNPFVHMDLYDPGLNGDNLSGIRELW